MRIVLPHYKCPTWNILYSGCHWTKRKEMADFAHISVKEALLHGKWTQYTSPVVITVTAFLKRPVDPDNVCAKLVIDGVKLCGVIKDDTYKEVSGGVRTLSVKSDEDYTIIDIAPI